MLISSRKNFRTFLHEKFAKFKGVSLFAMSSVILNFTGIISGFIVYKWVDPYYIGLWSSLLLVDTYSTFLRLGVINGMNREFPYWLGKGDTEKANRLIQTTFYYTLCTIALFLVGALVYFLF